MVDLYDIWYGADAIQGDLDAIIFNPIAKTILKWLKFKVVSWMHDFQPCTAMIWDCLPFWVTVVTSHTIFS
jgi:4-hydroxy-L-threonine phosphate dehydrogenase PdxA